MNSAEKKKTNWIRILRPIALALVLLFLLSYATYAWMKRDWKPTVHQENVKIVAGSSLTFIYGVDEIEDIPVNKLLNMDEFVFKSVSNASGESDHFFALNYSPQGEIHDTFNHLDENDIINDYDTFYSNIYTALGRSCGYVELQFKIASAAQGDVYDKEIYLDKESGISGTVVEGDNEATKLNAQAAEAVRISITLHETATEPEQTTVFAKSTTSHKAITKERVDGYGYIADGAPRYDTSKNPPILAETVSNKYLAEAAALFETKTIKTFESFETDPLFTLKRGEQRTITVRIWLEGEDANCTDAIAGSAIDLLLKFSAEDIRDDKVTE